MVRMGMLRVAKRSITASQVWPMEAVTRLASRGVGGGGGLYVVQPASRTQAVVRTSSFMRGNP